MRDVVRCCPNHTVMDANTNGKRIREGAYWRRGYWRGGLLEMWLIGEGDYQRGGYWRGGLLERGIIGEGAYWRGGSLERVIGEGDYQGGGLIELLRYTGNARKCAESRFQGIPPCQFQIILLISQYNNNNRVDQVLNTAQLYPDRIAH